MLVYRCFVCLCNFWFNLLVREQQSLSILDEKLKKKCCYSSNLICLNSKIRFKPHSEVVCNAFPIRFLQIHLSPDTLDISSSSSYWISKCLFSHLNQHPHTTTRSDPEWLSRTRRAVWRTSQRTIKLSTDTPDEAASMFENQRTI